MSTPAAGGPVLVRGKELHALPVVSMAAGVVLADVKDLIYSPSVGALLGVTLNKHGGIFAGPLKQTLWMDVIHALGRDAVMVSNDTALDAAGPTPDQSGDNDSGTGRNVIGNQVLTDAGSAIGVVTDLIVEIGMLAADKHVGSVVGYEVTGDASLQGREGKPLLLPLPYTLAVSGTTLVVPAAVEQFIRDDLSGFGAAVADYRSQLDAPQLDPEGDEMTALTRIFGTQVVSRADAEKVGKVEGAVIDIATRTVTAWQIGKGRKAQFVDHAHLTGIGEAAVIVDDAGSLREAATPLEEATAKGHHDLIKSLVLNEAGDALGHVTDADIDTVAGSIVTVSTDSTTIPAAAMLGFGSYALVVALTKG